MKAALLPLALALSGCAQLLAYQNLVPGSSREADAIAALGPPAATRALPGGGKALEYPREPEGMENWRVTIAPDGTVTAVEQVVSESYFERIHRGMSASEVLELLGRPSEEKAYERLEERVVSWRYREFGNRIMFFNAHFDPEGILKYASRSPDPITNLRGRR